MSAPAPDSTARRGLAAVVGLVLFAIGVFVGAIDWYVRGHMAFGDYSPAVTTAIVAAGALCLPRAGLHRTGGLLTALYGLFLLSKPLLRPVFVGAPIVCDRHMWFILPGLGLLVLARLIARSGRRPLDD